MRTRAEKDAPVDVWIAGPREPEEADGQNKRAENHRNESFLRDDFPMFLQLTSETGLGHPAG